MESGVNKVVFIGGARAITRLDANVQARLRSLVDSKCSVIIGDAAGVDKAVQQMLAELSYKPVSVYASNGAVRNNIGDWPVVSVEAPPEAKGFDFYACKDLQMAKDADLGFMIWNGRSRGTITNVLNLTNLGKTCLVYLTKAKRFLHIKTPAQAQALYQQPIQMISAVSSPQVSMFATKK